MPGEYKRILVAVDGSDVAKDAFKHAVEIANHNKGELLIAQVIELVKGYQTLDRSTLKKEAARVENTLAEYADYAKEHGVQEVRTLVRKGNSKEIITEILPKEENIELIIVGATGKGAVEHAFLGSVSTDVVLHAPIDVLVTRKKMEDNS